MIEVEYVDEDGNKKINERRDYQVMDKSNYLDEVFFVNDGVTNKGQEFIDYFKGFSKKVESVLKKKKTYSFCSAVAFERKGYCEKVQFECSSRPSRPTHPDYPAGRG